MNFDYKKYIRKYWDREDIINIINKAIHYNQPLNMYHTYDNGIIYIRLTYKCNVPKLEIFCELLFGDYAFRDGDKEKRIYNISYNCKVSDGDFVEIKGTNIDKIQRCIKEGSVICEDR